MTSANHDLLRLRDALEADDAGPGLPAPLLDEIGAVLGCDAVAFNGVDARQQLHYLLQGVDGVVAVSHQEAEDIFWHHFWQSGCSYPERTGDYTSITSSADFMSHRQHLASPMVVDLHRPTVGDLEMVIPDGAGRTLRLLCWRLSGSPFGERERFYLQLLRPHLIELYRRRERNLVDEPELTMRQLEVVGLVRAGLTNTQIARRLGISEGTVRTHLRDIFERLGVTSRTAAVVRAESVLGPVLDSVDPSRTAAPRWSA